MSIPTDPLAHIRADILAQPEAERADYALDLLAYYLAPLPAFFDGCTALGLDLCEADLRVLFALDRRRGRTVSRDALLAARYIDRPADDWGTEDKITRAICNIRPQLAALGLPVEIVWIEERGYRLTAPAGWRFEDAAPPDLFGYAGVRA